MNVINQKHNQSFTLADLTFLSHLNFCVNPFFYSCSPLPPNSGSLLTRNLGDLVKKEDFVQNSEYLVTLLVVVPK